MTTKRTTHRSTAGKKLYAVRDKSGRFKDVQTYKRAHAADLRRKSRAEEGTLAWGVYGTNGLIKVELLRGVAKVRVKWLQVTDHGPGPGPYTIRRVLVTPVPVKRKGATS